MQNKKEIIKNANKNFPVYTEYTFNIVQIEFIHNWTI